MKFQKEEYSDKLIEELIPLLVPHDKEVNSFAHLKLEPNFERYSELMTTGAMALFSIRNEERLIGYNTFFLVKSLHHKSSTQALQDALFLLEEFRGAEIGSQFVTWGDEKLTEMGMDVVYRSVTVNCDYSPVLKRLGYNLTETAYARRLY